MIVVKVELWPKGDESQAREIGRARITNTGAGTPEVADYRVELLKSAEYSQRNAGKLYRSGTVMRYPRRRGPWPLLMLAIQAALGKKS